jgi:hypothetical protein
MFSTILYMRTGTGAATIQFERFDQQVGSYGDGFLHLDLMPDNTVRIDDNDATKFGTFPRDQKFVVQVTLNINATPTAHILLSGAGASGERAYTILPPYVPLARQYGAVRLWMGYPSPGFFTATDIVVTHKPETPTQLTVRKILVHPDHNQLRLFNLRIDGSTVKANVNGGSTGPQIVAPGNHTVGETGGTRTNLFDFYTVIGGDCAADGTVTTIIWAGATADQSAASRATALRGAGIVVCRVSRSVRKNPRERGFPIVIAEHRQ